MKTIKIIANFLFLTLFLFLFVGCSVESKEELVTPLDQNSSTSFEKAKDDNFTTSLKGRNEVPAVKTKAAGEAIVRISKDRNSIYYKLIVSNLDNVVAAHFHMAEVGVNGPVVAFLFSGNVAEQNGILSEGVITEAELIGPLAGMSLDELIQRIQNGRIYVNVHTIEFPSGAIRGQL